MEEEGSSFLSTDSQQTDQNHSTTSGTTPFQTPPLLANSRRESSRIISRNITPLTPPPADEYTIPNSKDGVNDKNPASAYDPQDFTPSLHASLVSEILALRRELDSKTSFIDGLEGTLSNARNENDGLRENLSRSNKETRALKRELQMHEDGSFSTMDLLCKERDEVQEANADLRRRLDIAQRKSRAQDDESRRIYLKLDQERSKWDNERRLLDRKVHTAESRLKKVLEEVAASHLQSQDAKSSDDDVFNDALEQNKVSEPEPEPVAPQTPQDSPEHNFKNRSSVLSGGIPQKSLADELAFDDSENDDDRSVRDSVRASPIRRAVSPRQSLDTSRKESAASPSSQIVMPQTPDGLDRRVMMVSPERSESPVPQRPRRKSDSPSIETDRRFSTHVSEMVKRFSTHADGMSPKEFARASPNSRRKRQPLIRVPIPRHVRSKSDPSHNRPILQPFAVAPAAPAASAASHAPVLAPSMKLQKTIGVQAEILRLPPAKQDHSTQTTPIDLSTAAVQTDPIEAPQLAVPPAVVEPESNENRDFGESLDSPTVPFIKIRPPSTVGLLSGQSVLPPGTTSVGCQTAIKIPITQKSSGMQTEVIRVDRRLARLPPHLLPSAVPSAAPVTTTTSGPGSRSLSPVLETVKEQSGQAETEPGSRSSVGSRTGMPSVAEYMDRRIAMNRANRRSLFARENDSNLNSPTSATEYDSTINDDSGLRGGETTQSMSYKPFMADTRASESRRQKKPLDPPFETDDSTAGGQRHSQERNQVPLTSSRPSVERGRRRPAQSTVEQQARTSIPQNAVPSRTSSNASMTSSSYSKSSGPRPPFAIPLRVSSKPFRLARTNRDRQRSPRQRSPTYYSGSSSPTRREQNRLVKRSTVRKSRSSAVVENGAYRSSHMVPSPLKSEFGPVEESPPKQATGRNSKVFSIYENDGNEMNNTSSNRQSKRISTIVPTGNASVGQPQSTNHSVVDAITSTMIGEWMWKYMRKRKSFSVQDLKEEVGKSDSRHRRWVWVSPYERCIMWSSKQPTSNAALMGKTGRKLSIQSVLDVKDETPAPKGVASTGGIFNRSILVLTPDRALKFTASSQERHYLWLTALSYLSHNSSTGTTLKLPPLPSASVIPDPESISTARSGPVNSNATGSSLWRSSRGTKNSSGNGTPHDYQTSNPTTTTSSAAAAAAATAALTLPSIALDQAPAHQHLDVQPVRSKANIPEQALAPTIPRVPHSRKRSLTGPSRGRHASNNAPTLPTGSFPASSQALNLQYYSGGINATPVVAPSAQQQQNQQQQSSEASQSGKDSRGRTRGSSWRLPTPRLYTSASRAASQSRVSSGGPSTRNLQAFSETAPPPPHNTVARGQLPQQQQQQQQQPLSPLTSHPTRLGVNQLPPLLLHRERDQQLLDDERSPRASTSRNSGLSADFGGNSSFFDAVNGAIDLKSTDIYSSTGATAGASVAPGLAASPRPQQSSTGQSSQAAGSKHHQQPSIDSYYGSHDMSRARDSTGNTSGYGYPTVNVSSLRKSDASKENGNASSGVNAVSMAAFGGIT